MPDISIIGHDLLHAFLKHLNINTAKSGVIAKALFTHEINIS